MVKTSKKQNRQPVIFFRGGKLKAISFNPALKVLQQSRKILRALEISDYFIYII